MALELSAHAKVNLCLSILSKRADGYHEVDTILHELSLHDTLVAERVPDADHSNVELVVQRHGAVRGLPVAIGEDNLVCRAVRAYQGVMRSTGGVRFCLTKRIPAGGGLGGGSSDAGAALRLMNALHDDALGDAEMHQVAATLGADVPFFLRGRTQRGVGTGSDLLAIEEGAPLYFVLVLPRTGTSTVDIYKNHVVQLTPGARATNVRGRPVPVTKEEAVFAGYPNDLEPTALKLHPELVHVRDSIARAGCVGVRMSGSGSTFFVAMDSESERDAAFARLSRLDESFGLLRCMTRAGPRENPRNVEFPAGH